MYYITLTSTGIRFIYFCIDGCVSYIESTLISTKNKERIYVIYSYNIAHNNSDALFS